MNTHQNDGYSAPKPKISFKISTDFLCAFLVCITSMVGTGGLIAQESGSEIYNLSPFEISTAGEKGYSSTSAIGATRVATNILEVDSSITSLNREFIEDLGNLEIAEALVYISGVNKSSSTGNDSVSMRGIEGAANFLDGLPIRTRFGNMKSSNIGVERIEVVKGPTGALYGSTSGNGLINLVSKRPTAEPTAHFRAIVGTFDEYIGEVDMGGRSEKTGIGYRFAGRWQDAETKEGFPRNEKTFYLNMDRYLNENLRVWATTEMTDYEQSLVQNSFRAAPLDPTGDPRYRSLGLGFLDASSYYGDDDATQVADVKRIELGAEASFELFSNPWTGRLVARYGEYDYFRRTIVGGNYDFLDANGAVLGNQNNFTFERPGWVEIRTRGTFLNTVKFNADPLDVAFDLTGGFQIGPTDHTILTYLQFGRFQEFSGQIQYNMNPVLMINPEDVDISLSYGQTENLPSHVTGVRSMIMSEDSRNNSFRFGFNDTIRMMDGKLIFLGGASYTHSGPNTIVDKLDPNNPEVTNGDTNQDWTYKYSVIGKPTEWLSLFATHGETFSPFTGTNILGETFRNRFFESEEIGMKFIYGDGLLSGTISYFDSFEDGFITLEVQPDGLQVQRQNGIAYFDGIEADFALNAGGFQGIFGVSKVDAVTDTGQFHRGGNQDWNWSVFTKYSFQAEKLKGFSIGASMRHESERIGDGANTFWVPEFDVYDMLFAYKMSDWRIQLNVYNVFDEHYVLTAVNQNNVFFGPQRYARLTFDYSF